MLDHPIELKSYIYQDILDTNLANELKLIKEQYEKATSLKEMEMSPMEFWGSHEYIRESQGEHLDPGF